MLYTYYYMYIYLRMFKCYFDFRMHGEKSHSLHPRIGILFRAFLLLGYQNLFLAID